MRMFGMILTVMMGLNVVAQAAQSKWIDASTLKKIEAAVEESSNNNDNFSSLGGTALDKSDLQGQALKDYKKLMKDFGSDYPAEASEVVIAGRHLIMIVEMNDGGGEVDLYKMDGSALASLSGGESDEWTWSN